MHTLSEKPQRVEIETDTKKNDVVIIDDDPSFSFMLKDYLLSSGGINSELFSNGEDFLKKYSSDDRRIIILDYDFGKNADGLTVLQHILKKNGLAKIIMVSSVDNLETAIETMRRGATDYFLKTNKTVFANILSSINKLILLEKSKLN